MSARKKAAKRRSSYNEKSIEIKPRNKKQEEYLAQLLDFKQYIVFGVGPAGTGKTLLAVKAAIKAFRERQVDKIVITRPAVPVDEDHGHLPGTLEEKMAPWMMPIYDVFSEHFSSNEIQSMIADRVIEIAPLAYMRGRTFKHSYIIADEMQNATTEQMKMLLTRIGEGSIMAVTGDPNQTDRVSNNGMYDFMLRLANTKSSYVTMTEFKKEHVERHVAVSEVLRIYS